MSAPADETKQDESGPSESETELTARQEALIAALLSEPTQEAAADCAGVPRSTMYRWFQEPTFAARYRSAQKELFTHAMGRLQKSAGDALDTLREVMTDSATPPAARVTAARTVLDFSRHALEHVNTEERIAALELAAEKRRADPFGLDW